MKHLKVWQKLLVMGLVFMAPFAVVTYNLAQSIGTLGVEFGRSELVGLDYEEALAGLIRLLQQHRGMSGALLGGDGTFRERLAAKTTEIESAIQAVDEADRRSAPLGV